MPIRQLNTAFGLSNPTITQVGSAPQAVGVDKLQNVQVRGNYAYVSSANTAQTIQIFNIQNPAAPYLVSTVTGTGTYLFGIQGDYLYSGGSGSSIFYIVNIKNPISPFIASQLTISGGPGALYGTTISGNYAYISTQSKGLTVVDVSNPLIPAQVFQEGGTLNKSVGVFAVAGKVYTTNFQTTAPWTIRYLKIWDVLTTPATPILLSTYTLPAGTKPEEVSVTGNYAYVTDVNTNTIQIVDVSNPLAPNYLSSMAASGLFTVSANVAIDGNYAYISSGSDPTYGGLIDFFDITNKSAPIKVSTFHDNDPGSVYGAVVLANNYLYVANYGVAPGALGSLKIYSTQSNLSSPINVENAQAVSVQTVSAVGASGTYILQGSDDVSSPTNWNTLVSGSIAASTVYLIPKTDTCNQFIRVIFTSTGSGGIAGSIKTLD